MRNLMVVTILASVFASTVAFADKETADRIQHDGERAANRGDTARAKEAQERAREAKNANADRSRQIERDYNKGK